MLVMVRVLLACLFVAGLVLGRPPPGMQHPQNEPAEEEEEIGGAPSPADNTPPSQKLDYSRYLREVVQVLESDPDFRKKLEEADEEKIRDGSIVEGLDLVGHDVRTQLDDVKRREMERLRRLAARMPKAAGAGKELGSASHLEVRTSKFEKGDLLKLLLSAAADLEEADKRRREDFKRYEMEKKFAQQEKLRRIQDSEKRKEEERKLNESRDKHQKHEKVHHPLTKEQLGDVWEGADRLSPEDWDPKTFFALHDVNGDGFWDENETKMLFRIELKKVYDPNVPEDDMREREEEMEKMREHVFNETDKNKDRLISYDEFLSQTKKDEFEEDPGWDVLDGGKGEFSEEEFNAYQLKRQREIQDKSDSPPANSQQHYSDPNGGVNAPAGSLLVKEEGEAYSQLRASDDRSNPVHDDAANLQEQLSQVHLDP